MANPLKIKCSVKNIIQHDEKVFSLFLKSENRFPKFKPGQFLHLTIDDYDPSGGFWPESRIFSIASSPGKDEIRVVYSVKGKYTTQMAEYLALNKPVWLKLPYGDFIIENHIGPQQDVVLVAGGTGLTPYIPYLEKLKESSTTSNRKIILYYGIRDKSLFIFDDLIAGCAENLSNFELRLYMEKGDVWGRCEPGRVKIHSGKLSIEDIGYESGKLDNPVFFLSGPPPMLAAFKKHLTDIGISGVNIKIDEWE